MRWIFFIAALSPMTASANEGLERPLLKLLRLYAESAGSLDACLTGPGIEGLDEHIEMLAMWKHPGFWDRLTGSRQDYQGSLSREYRLVFLKNAIKPCEGGISLSTSRVVVSSASDSIRRETRQSE